jgi:subtilisin family serine protease
MAKDSRGPRRVGARMERLEDRRVMSAGPLVDAFGANSAAGEAAGDQLVQHSSPVLDLPAYHQGAGADFWINPDDQAAVDAAFNSVDQFLTQAHNLTGWFNVQNNYGFTGRGQTVAVIDSGIAWDHFALGGGFGANYRVVGGWDFTEENDGVPYDDGTAGGHGSHVAGIVGGNAPGNSGVAPGVDFVSLRVFNDTGQGFFSWVENALRWIHTNRNNFENPITAINLSLGVSGWNAATVPDWGKLEDEFAQLEADGIFIAVSAGNSFTSYNTPGLSYPAASQYVVPVMSTTSTGGLSSFSQRLGRAIAAPGQNITSTVPDYKGNKNGVADDYATMSGTSMAAPYVAGASVLIRQAMQFVGMTGITQDVIYDHMMATADTFYDAATGQNYKRLNLGRAIDALMAPDDFGSTLGTAFNMGALSGTTTTSGAIGTLTDVDYFTFTASASGTVTFAADGSQEMTPRWQVHGATPSSDSSGTVSFAVTAGQSYTVALSSTTGMGNYTFTATLEADSGFTYSDWGAVAYDLQNDVSVAGEQWYRIQATRDGLLTALAQFSGAGGGVQLALFNANMQQAAAGTSGGGQARVDFAATAGTEYFLRVTGAASDVDFKLLNLVSHDGLAVTVAGTAGDDAIEVTAGATHVVSINGVAYNFAGSTANQFTIDAGAGNDTFTFRGSSADETVELRVGSARVSSSGFGLTAASVENITAISGGGADSVALYDSAGDDNYEARPDRVQMSGAGYANQAVGFAATTAHASTGDDRAAFYDSAGADVFETRAGRATLRGAGYANDSYGFDRTIAYSTTPDDRAFMFDSTGDETFAAYADRSILQGAAFYHEARGFDRTTAFASGGNDRAGFIDTAGDEVFVAYADRAIMQGAAFYNEARGFDRATAYGSGGNDRAALFDSAGNDVFMATPTRAVMSGVGFVNEVRNFKKVTANASAGLDQAVFYDSLGDDTYAAWSTRAVMYSKAYYNEARGFDSAKAHATGGNDRAVLYDSAGNDVLAAKVWGAYMSGGAYYNEVRGFDWVSARHDQGGDDRAQVEATDYAFTLAGTWK